jgi:6-phosphofructokinase 2
MAANIVTLTMNPAIDVSTSVARISPAHKLRCAEPHRDPGGGGINVARVLQRYGADVLAVYVAGGATGSLLRQLVRREDIADLVIEEPQETREDLTVLETETGDQFRFVMPGPAIGAETWRAALDAVDNLAAPRFVVASGSLPLGVPVDFYARMARSVRKSDTKLVVDTSGAALEAALAEKPHLIKPNLRELGELVGAPLEHETEWRNAAAKLVADGKAEIVALTLGDKGALLATKDAIWAADTPKVNVVSTVGAGDSFLAMLVWSFASGLGPEAVLRQAVAAGSAALLSPGTDLCHPADVERLAAEIVTRRL